MMKLRREKAQQRQRRQHQPERVNVPEENKSRICMCTCARVVVVVLYVQVLAMWAKADSISEFFEGEVWWVIHPAHSKEVHMYNFTVGATHSTVD